jgi:hypothetical protein
VTSRRPLAWAALGLGLLLVTPRPAAPQLSFDDSPWRATAQVNGVTYRIWIDESAESDRFPHKVPWEVMQLYCRIFCFRCTPVSWGTTQIDRALNAAEQTPPTTRTRHSTP